jgi:hypothetical protein
MNVKRVFVKVGGGGGRGGGRRCEIVIVSVIVGGVVVVVGIDGSGATISGKQIARVWVSGGDGNGGVAVV